MRRALPFIFAFSTAGAAQATAPVDPPGATTPSSPGDATPAEPGAAKPPRRGVVELELTGLDGEQRAAALAALDIAAYTTRATIGSARLERLLGEAPDEIREALEVFGYYDATARVTRTPLPERRHRVLVAVERGEPVRIAAVDVTVAGPGGAEPDVVRRIAGFAPGVGAVLDHRAYESGKAAIERSMQRLGYFDARLLERRVEVTRATRTATIRLRWESGERYRFGATRFEGAQFPDSFMRRFRPWEDDEPYAQAQIEAMQQRLAAAGYFASMEIEPQLDDRADGRVPVRVGLAPAARSAWTIGAYYEANYGAGLRAGLERRWLNAAGHTARADLEAAQALQSLTFEYRIPHPSLHGAAWLAGIGLRNEDNDGIDARSGLLRAGLLGAWQDWTGIASANALRGDFRVGSPRRNPDRSNATVVYSEVSLGRVFARDRIRPREGGAVRFTARAASVSLASDVDLLQLRAEGRYVVPLGEASRLLGRLELGWTDTDRFDRLPPDLRFYAGGDGSVRGYAWQDLGPRDPDGAPLGAPRVATGSLEYERSFRPDWSWAVFVDGGNAFSGGRVAPEWGVGAGVRWSSPIGPVRLDLAWGLDAAVGGFQLHFSAGPDL
jgi:translocation and assembly module TamA